MTTTCTNCGADLTSAQSLRIAEYRYGHLTTGPAARAVSQDLNFEFDQPDRFTATCVNCDRLVRTLPL